MGFKSVVDLCRKILDYILTYSERSAHLTSSKLKVILSAVGANGTLKSRPDRSDLLEALQTFYDGHCLSHNSAEVNCLPHVPPEVLVTIARCHRLKFSNTLTMDSLRTLVHEHLHSGRCKEHLSACTANQHFEQSSLNSIRGNAQSRDSDPDPQPVDNGADLNRDFLILSLKAGVSKMP